VKSRILRELSNTNQAFKTVSQNYFNYKILCDFACPVGPEDPTGAALREVFKLIKAKMEL